MLAKIFVAGLFCAVSVAAVANEGGISATEIKLGSTYPFSGPASPLATTGKGLVAYVNAINDRGGINGRMINLIALDDSYSPPKTVEQTRRTWVVSGNLRAALLAATAGVLQDLVVAGENRQACAVLGWLNPVVAMRYLSDAAADPHRDQGVHDFIRKSLRAHNASVGSSERVTAVWLLSEPPSLAAGEVTDKAYVNQRAVLTNRSDKVDQLYLSEKSDNLIRIE